MRFPVVHLSFLPASGMAIFPFVLIKYAELKADRQIINHNQAYRNIIVEREAYGNDANYSYLSNRKFASWIKYFWQTG